MVVVTGILLPWVHKCASEASQQTACPSQRLSQQPVNWAGTMKTGSRSGSIHQAFYVCLLPPAICTEAVKPPLPSPSLCVRMLCLLFPWDHLCIMKPGGGGGWTLTHGKRPQKSEQTFPSVCHSGSCSVECLALVWWADDSLQRRHTCAQHY